MQRGNKLKIATWNVERLKSKNKVSEIIENSKSIAADIFVFTETDFTVKFGYEFHAETLYPANTLAVYEETERRVAIQTNYEIIQQYDTFNNETAVCVELKTDNGILLVYGVVIGILGNRHKSFMPDLLSVKSDIYNLSKENNNLCIWG